MARVVVAGLVNLETTLAVDGFPLPYEPVRYPFFGVGATVSGVGFNVAKALSCLGHEVVFAGLLGRDAAGREARAELDALGIPGEYLRDDLEETPRSVILYEPSGRRSIHVDLKDIQDRRYPEHAAAAALEGADLAVVCNINFARPFLEAARGAGIPVASDVHAIAAADDDYNRDWLEGADILFMSHERLPVEPRAWLLALRDRFGPRLRVVGCGGNGSLLLDGEADEPVAVPARRPRAIVNTIGAGDALFSAFVDGTLRGLAPTESLARAALYAGWKIGEKGAAEGLLDDEDLGRLAAGQTPAAARASTSARPRDDRSA